MNRVDIDFLLGTVFVFSLFCCIVWFFLRGWDNLKRRRWNLRMRCTLAVSYISFMTAFIIIVLWKYINSNVVVGYAFPILSIACGSLAYYDALKTRVSLHNTDFWRDVFCGGAFLLVSIFLYYIGEI